MSKSKLTKELARLSKEQIIQVVVDAYNARKETKAYFDFFLNPDVDKLLEKYKVRIARELNRTKRRMSKARISVINGAIKEFASFSPGDEHVIDLMLYTINYGLLTESAVSFSETLYNGFSKIVTNLLDYCDSHNQARQVMESLLPSLDSSSPSGSNYFRQRLLDTVRNFKPSKNVFNR